MAGICVYCGFSGTNDDLMEHAGENCRDERGKMTIDSQAILYPKGRNDECYTPRYGVEPIIKYLPEGKTIWCPFDTENSEYVKVLREKGFNVIYSHIALGQDFYTYEPEEEWDIMVSNPPFTKKKDIFKRALSFGKPIALLMSMAWLNDSGSKKAFSESDRHMQLLMFDNRIKFNNPFGIANDKITFSSGYYCSDLLPRDIILGGTLNTKD